MITVTGFDPGAISFWEIGEHGFSPAVKKQFPPSAPGKKPVSKYAAESTSVLLVEKDKKIQIVVGRLVTDEVLKNVMGYAMKQNKLLELRECETLDNLRSADRMVVLCNEFVESTAPRLDDIPLSALDSHEEF